MLAFLTSLELPIGRPPATLVGSRPSVSEWRHAVQCGTPDMNLEHNAGEHWPSAVSRGQEVIALHGISKRFGSGLALDNTTFAIAVGEVVVLLSAKGTGKRARGLRFQPTHRRSR